MALSDNDSVIGVRDLSLDCELRLLEKKADWECRDRVLLERFRGGDRDAFVELYQQHSQMIFHFAFSMTGDRAVATEITQDVFVWLIHNSGSFDPNRGAFGAFLSGVTRKLLKRRYRDERRLVSFDSILRTQSADVVRSDQTSDMVRAIDEESVRKAVLLLPWRYREAIVLCEFESRSYEEAAVLLGCAVGTIRSRLHRARELLSRKFQPKFAQR